MQSSRRRPGQQQVKQRGWPGHPDERGRDGPGGEISTGAHGERRPVPAPAAARHRHHRGEDQDHGPDRRPHQDRISMTEGDKAERHPGEAAERQALNSPWATARHNPGTTTIDRAVERNRSPCHTRPLFTIRSVGYVNGNGAVERAYRILPWNSGGGSR
jgi:hypothetical protein